MLPLMSLVGFLDFAVKNDQNVRWGQSAILLIWFFCYGTVYIHSLTPIYVAHTIQALVSGQSHME